jgi:hypothetical protein
MPTARRLARERTPSFDAEADWFADLIAFINKTGRTRPWTDRVRDDIRDSVLALMEGRAFPTLAGEVRIGGDPFPPGEIPTVSRLELLPTARLTEMLAVSDFYIILFRLASAKCWGSGSRTLGRPTRRWCSRRMDGPGGCL